MRGEWKKNIDRNKQIISLFLTGKYYARDLSKIFGISGQSILNVLRKHGVPRVSEIRRNIIRETRADIVKASDGFGISKSQARYLGASPVRTQAKTDSVIRVGQEYEELVAEHIRKKVGLSVELMYNHSPYDLLVGGKLRIDVKGKKRTSKRHDGVHTLWLWNVTKRVHLDRCDLFVFVMGNMDNVLIVPSRVIGKAGSVGFTLAKDKMTTKPNKLNGYFNDWDRIKLAFGEILRKQYRPSPI